MIKMYLELDMKSPGVFGFRPLMDLSRTCYCKNARFLRKSCPALSMDSEFMDKLDTCSACKLPPNMKTGICKLIEQHCFNSGLSINMDITSVANLPENLKMTFSQLLQHVYSIDSRTQDLVLNLLKVISDNCPRDDDEDINTNGVNASADNYNSRSEDIMAQKDCSNCEVPPVLEDAAMPAVGGSISEDQCHTHLPTTQLPECSKKAFVPNLKSSSIKISSQV
uniref:Uncharacterized protein n=1 Tax=Arundo donax TaxID=35708 RepID=A0A0A9E5I1_ARUDO